jgi:hypothetical protein
LPPRDVSPRRPQVARPPGQPVQPGREQGPGGERLPGLERVVGVPPDPAPPAIPPGALDEAEGPPRVVEVPAIAPGPVGVEEHQAPPAIVVEPGARPSVALTRVGGIARYPAAKLDSSSARLRGRTASARLGSPGSGGRSPRRRAPRTEARLPVAGVRPGLRAHGHEHQRDDESYSDETHRRLWAKHSCRAAGVLRAGASRPLPTLPLCRRPPVP